MTSGRLAGSPAIDAPDSSCPGTDQRGVTRPQGAACDIGAYEAATGTAATGQASAIGIVSATLNGSATNPDPVAGTASFQYGPTIAYGLSTAVQPVAPSTSAQPFAANIAGLQPGTAYHFRAVASNAAGTVFGADQTFVTTTSPAPPPRPAPPPPTRAPALSGLSLSPSRFRAATSGPSTAKSRGTTVKYTLSKAAKVRFGVERSARGRRVGGKCVTATRSNAGRKACRRYVPLKGSFTQQGRTGRNTFRFTGRLGGHTLKPKTYRLRAVAIDPTGKRSATRRPGFRIV